MYSVSWGVITSLKVQSSSPSVSRSKFSHHPPSISLKKRDQYSLVYSSDSKVQSSSPKCSVLFDVQSLSAFGHSAFGHSVLGPYWALGPIRPFVFRPSVIRPFVFRPLVIRPFVIRPFVFRPYVGESYIFGSGPNPGQR